MRKDRNFDQLRDVTFETNVNLHAEGSCLVKFGNTHVLCTASIDEKTPPWLRNSGKGWVTAEYGMLPRSTNTRIDREAARGKQSGRTQEIQRLIGRSLRSVTNLQELGERQIKIDCDVIQADGGTRTASISGGFVALYQAIEKLKKNYNIQQKIIKNYVAAISVGIVDNKPCLDLDYEEDSAAQVDANFVICDNEKLSEIQVTGEEFFFQLRSISRIIQTSTNWY
jgi:ribonuclease PH